MRILIVAAMDKEKALLLNLMKEHTTEDCEGISVNRGEIKGHDILLAKCGIGKVNSALVTSKLIDRYKPELVINSGVAGGADEAVKVGTVLAVDGAGYHDVWCGPGTQPGEADGFPLLFRPYEKGMEIIKTLQDEGEQIQTGIIATGDKFITTPEEIAAIKAVYPEAKACDMESASIAQACAWAKVPFMVIRVVSDTPGAADNLSQYRNFWSEAPEKTFHVLNQLLERL